MTEIDTSALADLTARREAKKQPTAAKGLHLDELHYGTYLAADPSFAFGLVMMEVSALGIQVHMAEKLVVASVPNLSGWEDTLTRAEILESRLEIFVRTWITNADWGTVLAVHEAPPMGHGKMLNPEVSLLTGYAFRRATSQLPMLAMVRRQDHCRLVCGNPNASKQQHHHVLRSYYDRIHGSELVTNEATRDALSVALYAAARDN